MEDNLIDFKLNDNYDLVFSEAKKNEHFKISFCIADSNVFRIVMNTNPTQIKEDNNNFCISFKTRNFDFNKTKYTSNIVEDWEAIAQLIEIRLLTDEKESEINSVNSSLQKLKHTMFIESDDFFENIKQVVLSKINDIVEDATVNVEYKKGTGNFYCQNINIDIYNKYNKLIYSYII